VTCPADTGASLGIRLPWLVLLVKNTGGPFCFEVELLDDRGARRRFRAATFTRETRKDDQLCAMPLKLDEGWNQVAFDLADFMHRAYGTVFKEAARVTVHANCRLRRIYFCDRAYAEDELPPEFRLHARHAKNAAAAIAAAVDDFAAEKEGVERPLPEGGGA
jgi:hypothetical protein